MFYSYHIYSFLHIDEMDSVYKRKTMKKRIQNNSVAFLGILIVSLLAGSANLGADTADGHEEHIQHVGFLVGAVYNLHEERFMLGLGAEYEYVLPFWDNLFGIGLAGEMVFDDHRHYVLSLLLPVHLWREFSVFAAAGLMFIDKDETERRFAVHFGAEYEFELNKFFLAPEFEVAFAGDDIHLMFGIHLGFGF